MTKLDISLPDDVKALADEQITSGQYRSFSEYVASLIRRDRLEQEEKVRTEAVLLERLRSGPAEEMRGEDFDRIRQRVEARIAQRRQP